MTRELEPTLARVLAAARELTTALQAQLAQRMYRHQITDEVRVALGVSLNTLAAYDAAQGQAARQCSRCQYPLVPGTSGEHICEPKHPMGAQGVGSSARGLWPPGTSASCTFCGVTYVAGTPHSCSDPKPAPPTDLADRLGRLEERVAKLIRLHDDEARLGNGTLDRLGRVEAALRQMAARLDAERVLAIGDYLHAVNALLAGTEDGR